MQLLLTWSGPRPSPLLRSWTAGTYLEELGKMATAFPVREIQLLTIKIVQTSIQEKRVLELFFSGLFPNDLWEAIDAKSQPPPPCAE